MKKQLLTGCCVLFIALNSKAQLDTIPNASFENWQYLPNATVRPTGWHDNDNSIAAWNVMPDSMANTGFLSAKIEYVSYRGILWSGFPISHHPLSLDGFMKNYLDIGDTAIISIQIYSSSILVDSGYAEIYGGIATVFLPFTVSISQNATVADSCVITLTGGNMFGSISWFDDLSFSFPASISNVFSGSGLTIFPNPFRDELVIRAPEFEDNAELTIYNTLGKKVFESHISNHVFPLDTFPVETFLPIENQTLIDLSQLSSGIYLLSISENKKISQTIIIKD